MIAYLNGEFVDRSHATVSVDDRGFLFGDGVYEVTRAHDGRLFEPEPHLRRLRRGLDALAIGTPTDLDDARLLEISDRLLQENGLHAGDATVYVQITRGAAARTHHFPPAGTRPTVYASASRLPAPDDARTRGVSVLLVPDQRWARCDLKTINLLPNVLAKQDAVVAGAYEAVMVRGGVITEGASTNVFVVLDGVLRTHPATPRILPGITRDVVLELARDLGVSLAEDAAAVADLAHASEMFLTSTTNDVMPVVRVDATPIGNGAPGPVARRLYDAMRKRMLAPVPAGA